MRPRSAASGSAAARSAAHPPSLTGGESLDGERAKVDWLTATWKPDPDEHVAASVHAWFTDWLGGVMGESVSGLYGYESGVRFYVPYMGSALFVGRVDFGGQHHGGRARLELTGSGCTRVLHWHAVQRHLEQLQECTLTRVDLALDCLNGEFTVEDARDWYQAGEFNAGGRMPRVSSPGDWFAPEVRYGRTLEVGRRENGKMLRCYEKGRQLGDQNSNWTRFEVELRNNDRDLPFDVLTRCDEYFVGAYRCLQRVLDAAAEKIRTHQKEGQIAVEVMKTYARDGYGQLLHVLRATGLSADDIVNELARPGVPRRLERASLGGFFNSGPPPLPH